MDNTASVMEDSVSCVACDVYVKKNEIFTCSKCRRTPLCKSHRVPGKRECTSCIFEMKSQEIRQLRKQDDSIQGILRLLQFIFLLFAVLFVALRMGVAEYVEFLQFSPITDNLVLLAIISVVGYLIFYFIMYNQRVKISELEKEMNKTEFRRMVK